MSSAQHHGAFGRPALPHTVVIARGEKIRHFTVRPAMLALTTALVSAAVIGAFGSVAYVVLHQDLQTAGVARQARLAQAYEDRIATLRAQLDRSVSRQLLDREKVETKVAVLLDQQVELEARYDKLAPLLDRARSSGLIDATADIPVPVANPRAVDGARTPEKPLAFSSTEDSQAFERFKLVDRLSENGLAAPIAGSKPPISSDLLRSIGEAVETHEARQIEKLDALAEGARTRAEGITDALRTEGIRIPSPAAAVEEGRGGLFEPVPEGYRFEASLTGLDSALAHLDAVRTGLRHLPLERPVSTTAVSSTFGVRSDPFLGQAAMHTGLDFPATSGTPVSATAAGTVVSAGPAGGYGQMVEVDHGDGYVTRFAHLSRVLVDVGATVSVGDLVGEVGSTGRSTGPHLHYEVRRSGVAVDPAGFLRAGRKIGRLG